ncbi:hypothetical protein HRbin40_00522 [bacterium HR40]|nr:hypothetical protein HRbin40_00522 [bacterium HR40]
MFTDAPDGAFEPDWFRRSPIRSSGAPSRAGIWPEFEEARAAPVPAAAPVVPTPAGPTGELTFDEAEVARLCAAVAARARAERVAVETAAVRARLEAIAAGLRTAWNALEQAREEELRATRRRLGLMLAEAFSRLAPQVLDRFRRQQLAHEIAEALRLLREERRIRVFVPPDLVEPIAAAVLADGADTAERIEILPDEGCAPAGCRIEGGEATLDYDPARMVAAIAAALRAVLEAPAEAEPTSPAARRETDTVQLEEHAHAG